MTLTDKGLPLFVENVRAPVSGVDVSAGVDWRHLEGAGDYWAAHRCYRRFLHVGAVYQHWNVIEKSLHERKRYFWNIELFFPQN